MKLLKVLFHIEWVDFHEFEINPTLEFQYFIMVLDQTWQHFHFLVKSIFPKDLSKLNALVKIGYE